MHLVRTLRTGAATGVIAWKLIALALLPAAFCCQAMLAADGTLACCKGTDHGAYCPLQQAARDASSHDGPQLQTCETSDDALLGLLSLTGFTPESAAPLASLDVGAVQPPAGDSGASLHPTPPSPPPRA